MNLKLKTDIFKQKKKKTLKDKSISLNYEPHHQSFKIMHWHDVK